MAFKIFDHDVGSDDDPMTGWQNFNLNSDCQLKVGGSAYATHSRFITFNH